MNYSTNFNLRLPERNEQFNLDDWNNNTTSIDSAMQTNKTNISNNATNITSILNGLSTVNTSDTSSIYYKLMKLIYPVGSLYWSSKSTNPASLFGGTWVQIKDRFVLACGDTYKTVGATGGASSVTLSVSNMPSHTHSFTPSGTVSSHSHGLNSHTHGFTPSGTVSSHSHTINSGNTAYEGTKTTAGIRHSASTGAMSDNARGYVTGIGYPTTHEWWGNMCYSEYSHSGDEQLDYGKSTTTKYRMEVDVQHTHSLPTSYIYGSTDLTQPTFTGSAGTTGAASGNTASATPTFTGSAGTTGSNGSGTSFSILPPYVVKYCFERTA